MKWCSFAIERGVIAPRALVRAAVSRECEREACALMMMVDCCSELCDKKTFTPCLFWQAPASTRKPTTKQLEKPRTAIRWGARWRDNEAFTRSELMVMILN